MNQQPRKAKEPYPDIAVRWLRERRQAVHYKELIAAVMEERGDVDPSAADKAYVLTQINLDARFVHMGKGVWGLRDWAPPSQKPAPVVIPGDYLPKARDYIFDEEQDDDIDDESDLLVPIDSDDVLVVEDDSPLEVVASDSDEDSED